MSFNVKPANAGSNVPAQTITTKTSPAYTRAIQAMKGELPSQKSPSAPAQIAAQPEAVQTLPVRNSTAVSPEEYAAIIPPTSKVAEASEQKHSEEGTSAEAVESPKEATSEPAKEPEADPLSKQYAVLARKEKALRAKTQELQAKSDAFTAREEALKSKEAEYQQGYISKDRLAADPLSVLNELGLSYEQLTQLVLDQPRPEDSAAYRSLKDEIKALKDLQEKSQKSAENQQKQAYEQAVNQIRSEAKSLVTSDPSFETIKETNSVQDVVDLIEQTFKSDGILLSVEEACQEVENYLVDEAIKIARLKKIQQRLAPAPKSEKPEAPKQVEPAPMKAPEGAKTLTNNLTNSKKLSARERAIMAYRGSKN